MPKKVSDKILDCKSPEGVDSTWRKSIIDGLDDGTIDDGIFFGTPKKKTKDGKNMMIVAIKSESVEPDFLASIMGMLPRTFLMKISKAAVWSEKGQCYGAELLSDDELKTIATFVTKSLMTIYMDGLNPETLFPKDKELQKRWSSIITTTVREEAEKMKKGVEK